MGRQSRKRKEKRDIPHPTLFVLEGSIRHYEGSMLELYPQLNDHEWKEIIDETVKFKVFLECLKEVACPILKESWTEEDDYYRLVLEHNIARMRNIDPMIFLTINENEIKHAMENKMRLNAHAVASDIQEYRNQYHTHFDHGNINVSDL